MNNDPKTPATPAPNSQHPQAKAIGKNKFNKAPKKFTEPGEAEAAIAKAITATAKSEEEKDAAAYYLARAIEIKASAAPAPKPAAPAPSEPGKDKSYFELTIKLVGSDEPPFVVEVPLTGNGANDKANAVAVARKKFPGHAMSIISSRIYTKSENALTEIAPGSTLSALFGASGEITSDLIEVGRAVHDGSRGAIFLRNLRTSVGVTFRPFSGGLIVFSNRIASNRLASELPLIIAEVLGRGAREIEIFLKS